MWWTRSICVISVNMFIKHLNIPIYNKREMKTYRFNSLIFLFWGLKSFHYILYSQHRNQSSHLKKWHIIFTFYSKPCLHLHFVQSKGSTSITFHKAQLDLPCYYVSDPINYSPLAHFLKCLWQVCPLVSFIVLLMFSNMFSCRRFHG